MPSLLPPEKSPGDSTSRRGDFNIFRRKQKSQRPSGFTTPFLVASVVVILILSITAGWFYLRPSEQETIAPILAEVTKGEFVAQVVDQGELQSSENVEIRCEVRARNGEISVNTLIPEGTQVKEGDFLIQLNSTAFEKELEEQKIKVANAETEKIQAEAAVASANAALVEYSEGIFVEGVKTIENEIYDAQSMITTAQQELKQAQAVYEHSKKLHAKAFITKQTLEADQFAVKRAEIAVKKGINSLELAEKKMKVLKEITFEKSTIQFNSDIRAAEIKLASANDNYQVEKSKLDEINSMIEKCTIRVPPGVSGQVVYAKEQRRGDDWVLEEGIQVRENQVLIRLPNPQKMEVKALINEQSITQVQPYMPVSIRVDALNDQPLKGVVTKVNQYAESGGWMRSSVRKYAVFVRVIDPPPTLKPGMNASVAIQTQFEPEAVIAPIQTVYGLQNQKFCLAKVGNGKWKTIQVQTGGDNAEMVLFTDGVEPGMQLVMNPGAYKQYMDLPELKLDSKIEIPDQEVTEQESFRQSMPSSPVVGDESPRRPEKQQQFKNRPQQEDTARRQGRPRQVSDANTEPAS